MPFMPGKIKAVAQGGPLWIVTFADLMSLLVAFFVLIVSFSIQDKQKLQIVAGSMRDAFGVKMSVAKAGMIEIEGVPVRDFIKRTALIDNETNSDFAEKHHNRKHGPEVNTHKLRRAGSEHPRQFSAAAVSLKQAWRELPEINELSENIIVEETPQGLHIQLLDQEGRAMFAAGSAILLARARRLLRKMAPILKALPNRIIITGHSDSVKLYQRDGYSLWELTSDRAHAVRRELAAAGVPYNKFHSIVGRADTQPLFPEDSFMAANRRISILIMNEAPPLPVGYKP